MKSGAATGNCMIAKFKERFANNPKVVEVKGQGMMMGIQLSQDCPTLVERAKEKNLLLNVTAGNTIRLLPPLILTEEQAQTVVDTVVQLVEEIE